jgi:glucose-6-phosphate isomerase
MDTAAALALREEVRAIAPLHLRDLLKDPARCEALRFTHGDLVIDLARQRMTQHTLARLLALAEERDLPGKIAGMFAGEHLNRTEDRAVLHTALRAPDGEAREDVRAVRDQIYRFSAAIRDGGRRGITGRLLTDTVAIGIGGSYLGPEFLHEALRTDPTAAAAAPGRRLRFLANVDPIDVHRALDGLDPATTLVVVISKTFTTAETLLNARTVRRWIVAHLGESAVRAHMVAVSTARDKVAAFGIDPENAFGFWDWVGGRYSATSAVGLLPLALQYGEAIARAVLAGAHDIDVHFRTAPLARNLPVLLGLAGVWNATYLGHGSRAFLPYCQALHRLPAHLQQVSMESNGKGVDLDGHPIADVGPVEFGEPGTNGQHSFYQLIHQGRVVPCDFVGFRRSQRPLAAPEEVVSNHDELMANFFAQPDALAVGRTAAELAAAGVSPALVPHKTFGGNRPSSVWLLEVCDAVNIGRLLALVEHRTAVEGFVWGVNSFDQWGVELGKVLGVRVRDQLAAARGGGGEIQGFNPSTTALLRRYLG